MPQQASIATWIEPQGGVDELLQLIEAAYLLHELANWQCGFDVDPGTNVDCDKT